MSRCDTKGVSKLFEVLQPVVWSLNKNFTLKKTIY